MTHKHWGFDTKAMDTSVRPQDDFYRYANGTWLKNTKIPPSESRWGSFLILRYETEKQLKVILADLLKKKRVENGEPEQLVRDLYLSAMDQKQRNKVGIAPLAPYLALINKISDHTSLITALSKLHRFGVTVPWGFAVDQDSKNSEKNVLHLYQSGLSMPDKEYYLKDEPEFLRVRTAYVPFVANMFRFLGVSKTDAAHMSVTVLKVETELAKVSMNKEDTRDADKTYHKLSMRDLKKLAPTIPWDMYFKLVGIPPVPYLIVTQPEFLKKSTELLATITIEEWKTYLTWHILSDAAPYLSSPIVKTNFGFYGQVLTGQKQMRAPWRRALSTVNVTVGFALGKIYVDRYFGAESKQKMNTLVDDLFKAYESRMHGLDWMSTATKKKAIAKLRAVSRKIGYPTKWKSYRGLTIVKDNLFANVVSATEFGTKRELAKLKKSVDRTEWHMTPQTVNAYCNFGLNEIVFPAAILQHPFFGLTSDDAVNYGAIGSVIGHELTHAFDDQGSKFDLKGNMKSWWTDVDRKQFEKKAKMLVDQFNAFVVEDGVHVNGQLTLGENIADLGGLVIAYDALQTHLKKVGRKDIDGFTPEQRFFFGFAQQEQELRSPEFQKTAVLTDPHSPAEFRINGPLVHMPEFYEAFGVTKGDPMYRGPKDRAHIW